MAVGPRRPSYFLCMDSSAARVEPPSSDDIVRQVGAPRPRGIRRLLRGGAVILALSAIVAALVVWRSRASTPLPPKYLTAQVQRGDLAATVTATGTLRGKDTVSVGAETSGRVKRVAVDFNDRVTAGQVLAELDPSQLQSTLDQANAQLVAARAEVKSRDATATEARLNAERVRALAADGLASRQQLEAAVAAADRATASAEAGRAQITVSAAAVQSNLTALSKTQIRSPIDGVVLSRDVEVGQALAVAMTTPVLFKVAKDLREMEVTISIDEADVGHTRPGQKATFTVDAWPSRPFPGELASIHNVAVTRDNVVTYEALLRVANDELLLRPGMTATVSINTDERVGVLLVPNAALRFRPPPATTRARMGPPDENAAVVSDLRPRVYVLREGRAEELLVEVGLTDGVHSEVTSAQLAAGDAVIVDAEQVTR